VEGRRFRAYGFEGGGRAVTDVSFFDPVECELLALQELARSLPGIAAKSEDNRQLSI
jgi:hypothetical protein